MPTAVLHVTGARPNFPKLAPVQAALAERGVEQRIVHTGQHYDDRMSDIFFRELDLPRPDVNLGIGSGSHAEQTARTMIALEGAFLGAAPQLVLVYGDINSTLAAAVVAAKLGIPLGHVEAGLRSFDMTMPEEINRLVTDRLSNVLFATSEDAIEHLVREGTDPDAIHFVGNPMIDTLLRAKPRLDSARAKAEHGVEGAYIVGTLHRPSNVDDPDDVAELVRVIHAFADLATFVMPVHPRGRARLVDAGLTRHPRVIATDPLGYLDFISLVSGSDAVVTDSGGVQEETTILGVPCFTMRPNTERPVTITNGTNQLVTRESVVPAVAAALAAGRPAQWPTPPLWDGHAGERIADVVQCQLA
ncbi:MAG: UDP-N-acetylglucosamine 2-epimerase (non-hydrolyzing) [Demequina sp.]|nr:UDP-N-acetylglucosamine 2-epimerase (non-hydrolyzing) [Demequina sp.]